VTARATLHNTSPLRGNEVFVLLLLAHFGKEGAPETVIPKISQEILAEMIGTTPSRVNFFMNRFRKLGFIGTTAGCKSTLHF
jgi:Crp-like helix-turn-helix protein